MRGFWGIRSFVAVVVTVGVVFSGALVAVPAAVAAAAPPPPCSDTVAWPYCVPADSGTVTASGAVTVGAPVSTYDYGDGRKDWEYPVYLRTSAYPPCAYGFGGYLYEVPCTEMTLDALMVNQYGEFQGPNLSFGIRACGDPYAHCKGDGQYKMVIDLLKSPDDHAPVLFVTTTRTVMARGTAAIVGTAYDLLVGGPKAPQASFDLRNDTSVPGQIIVTSTSTPTPNELYTTWDFGDGSSAEGAFTTHAYTMPGDYTVTMTVRDQTGRTATTTKQANIAAPALGVTIDLIGAAPPLAEDADITARVTVSASADGVGALSGLTFDGAALLASSPTTAFAVPGDPTPALPATPFTLAPGEQKQWTIPLHTAARGNYTLSSTITGTDAGGRAVTATGTSPGEVGQPFAVKITYLDANGDAIDRLHLEAQSDGTPIAQTVTVKTVITNDTTAPLTGLEAQPVDLRAADPQHPYEPFPAAIAPPNEAVKLADLAPGASVTVTRPMTVSADGAIVASQLIASDEGLAIGRAPLNIGLTAMLVMQLSGETHRSVVAGAPITIFGTLKNVTNDKTLALTDAVKVIRSSNLLGGGYLASTDGQNATADFPAPLIGDIAPGQTKTFQVKLTSARPAPEDYETTAWADDAYTKATALFSVPLRAAIKEDDGTWSALTIAPLSTQSKYPGSIVVKGDTAVTFDIDSSRVSDSTAFQNTVVTGFGLSVGALEGSKRRLDNIATYATDFVMSPSYRDKQIADALDLMTQFAVFMPQADHAALVEEVATNVSASLAKFGGEVVGGFHQDAPTKDSIQAQLEAMTTKLQAAWGSDDPMRIVDAIRPTGQVIGVAATDALAQELALAAFAKLASTQRYLAPTMQKWADQKTIKNMQANLPSAAQIALEKNAIEISKSKYPALEEAFTTRKALSDLELGAGANLDGAGLAQQTIDKARQWTKENPNRSVVLIPNEANVAAARNTGEAVGKIENVKPKSMAEIELAVLGGRAEDKNMVVLRDLSKVSVDDANRLVDAAIARGDIVESDRAVVQQILDKRKKEWAKFTNRGAVKKESGVYVADIDQATGQIKPDGDGIGNLKGYAEAGRIPNQFRGADNGLSIAGPELAPKFGLDYFDSFYLPTTADDAVYAVLKQENPITGLMAKITGDDDGIFLGLLNGLGLPREELNAAYTSLMDVFNHPFSDTWTASIEKKLEIFSRYFETIPGTETKGAPLVMMVNGEAYAVKINGATSRFDIIDHRAFIDFVGAPAAVDAMPRLSTFADVLLNKVPEYLLPAMFLKALLTDKSAFQGQPIRTTTGGKIVRMTLQGAVESWTLGGGWQADPDASAQAKTGKLALAPQSLVTTTTPAGATRVELMSAEQVAMAGPWFAPGDQVVIDPGGAHQEVATVSALGSLIFATGLAQPHAPGEVVASLGSTSGGSGAGTGGSGTGGSGTGGSGTGGSGTGGSGTPVGGADAGATASTDSRTPQDPLARTGLSFAAGDIALVALGLLLVGVVVVLRRRFGTSGGR